MAVIIIAKNIDTADVTIEDLGITIPLSGQRTLTDTFDYSDISESDNLYDAIFNDDITLNDGVGDLNKSDALKYLNPTTEYTDTTGEGTGSNTYTGSGAPSAGLGEDDDIYIDTVAGEYYQKVSASWVLKGDFGEGSSTYTGTGVPSAGLGADDDFYIDNDAGEYYQKETGAWVLKGDFGTIPSGSTPPPDPEDGSQWYYSTTGVPYYWDNTRDKWLSTTKVVFAFTKKGTASNSYLRVGEVINDETGFYIHQASTITGIYCSSITGNDTKVFEVRDAKNSHATISSFAFAGGGVLEYSSSLVDVDVDSGFLVQIWVSGDGGNVSDVVCEIEVSLRYEAP